MRIEQFILSISSFAVALFSQSVFADTNKCSVCNGKRYVETWDKCQRCNGRTCTKCVNSVKRGRVRVKHPCEACKERERQARIAESKRASEISRQTKPWEIEYSKYVITDVVTYHAHTCGTEVHTGIGTFLPMLIVRITPTGYEDSTDSMKFDPDVFIWTPAIKRKSQAAKVEVIERFDSFTPTTYTWEGSDNICSLFCPDPNDMFTKLMKSKTLSIRFEHGNKTFTTTFDLKQLKPVLSEIKQSYLVKTGKKKAVAKKSSVSQNGSMTSESRMITSRQIRESVLNQIAAEEESKAFGYYEYVKTKFQSKRLNHQPNP